MIRLTRIHLVLALLLLPAFTEAPRATDALAGADFADPFVLHDRGAYYAFATGTAGIHIQVAHSRDLATWGGVSDALPELPSWASRTDGFTWAPSVVRREGTYVLYYTARDAASDHQCISRAVAARPEGPYHDDSARPFVCQVAGDASFCGSIDPSPFVDAAGRLYLYWKSDENDPRCGGRSRLWGQELTSDGLALRGAAAPLLAVDRPWERPLVEGPSMVARDGRHYLFYSANWYESAGYAIGYATCDGPLGPCAKATTSAPLVASRGTLLGPGGQEFFDGPDGEPWVAYHAWTAPRVTYGQGGARSLRLARLTFERGAPRLDPQAGVTPSH